MKTALIPLLLALSAATAQADDIDLKSLGLTMVDKNGCRLSDGSVEISTINLMTAAYDEPGLSRESVVRVIKKAIDVGCDVNEPDQIGVSPLNAAILYNQPELVSLFLSHGANAKAKMVSPKASINGLDSCGFLNLLEGKEKVRGKIWKLLPGCKNKAQ
ncbi:hypothetical protein QCD60_08245 [Pokkaliibacter sp. MBI-7]|uniref:hypothetical protein n=1 Tax=Pokkaliibacter sp. MBI-7 TaxID=3040600 RepID=UPI0024468194|nr:hypothetical protein [Pokkaliibacter sp. MBI-7]MDH2432554.1 hypothetical protein [Pokkaliibacter sp. MBI-7]